MVWSPMDEENSRALLLPLLCACLPVGMEESAGLCDLGALGTLFRTVGATQAVGRAILSTLECESGLTFSWLGTDSSLFFWQELASVKFLFSLGYLTFCSSITSCNSKVGLEMLPTPQSSPYYLVLHAIPYITNQSGPPCNLLLTVTAADLVVNGWDDSESFWFFGETFHRRCKVAQLQQSQVPANITI